MTRNLREGLSGPGAWFVSDPWHQDRSREPWQLRFDLEHTSHQSFIRFEIDQMGAPCISLSSNPAASVQLLLNFMLNNHSDDAAKKAFARRHIGLLP